MAKYSRGAEWRKWDLHFHTPSSSHCYKDKSVTDNDIVEGWENKGLAHGQDTYVTVARVKEWHMNSRKLIEIIERQCGLA